jgi:two-component system NtrC family sensor kinase
MDATQNNIKPMAVKRKNHLNLRLRIIAVLLSVSLLPMLFMGAGAWIVFGRLLERKALELQRTVVENHAYAIESHLEQLLSMLQLLANTSNLTELTDQGKLGDVFENLNQASNRAFEDLGIIGPGGDHLAYIGPYELLDRNYRTTDWFKQVMTEGAYISDVFLGYRQVPHCIIAVKSAAEGSPWILRGTIDSQQFDALVHTSALGETGDVFIVNRDGTYQTTSRTGQVLTSSEIVNPAHFQGVKDKKIQQNGTDKIQVKTWINGDNWLLVAQQDANAVRAPVNKAIAAGAVIVLIAIVLITVTTFAATRHLTNQIDKANARREEMFKAFMRSAKLASIGELATGLAHEINNPLAIISADQTNICDIISDMDADLEGLQKIDESLQRCKRQVERCKNITTKMLQFGRKRETEIEPTDLAKSLQEIVNLMDRQAKVRDVELTLEAENHLPSLLIDAIELEQVIVNLITNSFQALPAGGHIKLVARLDGNEMIIEVVDNGCGIEAEALERIFEPFYTTKPVGEGTGLGLSVCYGIVQSWGGKIEAESEPNQGTTIRIRVPVIGFSSKDTKE